MFCTLKKWIENLDAVAATAVLDVFAAHDGVHAAGGAQRSRRHGSELGLPPDIGSRARGLSLAFSRLKQPLPPKGFRAGTFLSRKFTDMLNSISQPRRLLGAVG